MLKTRTWLFVVVCCFALSVAAVGVHFLPYAYAPRSLVELAEIFASPGELLWWSTLGGAFAGYPSDATGCLVWALGTAFFWILVVAIGVAVGKGIRRMVKLGRQYK